MYFPTERVLHANGTLLQCRARMVARRGGNLHNMNERTDAAIQTTKRDTSTYEETAEGQEKEKLMLQLWHVGNTHTTGQFSCKYICVDDVAVLVWRRLRCEARAGHERAELTCEKELCEEDVDWTVNWQEREKLTSCCWP